MFWEMYVLYIKIGAIKYKDQIFSDDIYETLGRLYYVLGNARQLIMYYMGK